MDEILFGEIAGGGRRPAPGRAWGVRVPGRWRRVGLVTAVLAALVPTAEGLVSPASAEVTTTVHVIGEGFQPVRIGPDGSVAGFLQNVSQFRVAVWDGTQIVTRSNESGYLRAMNDARTVVGLTPAFLPAAWTSAGRQLLQVPGTDVLRNGVRDVLGISPQGRIIGVTNWRGAITGGNTGVIDDSNMVRWATPSSDLELITPLSTALAMSSASGLVLGMDFGNSFRYGFYNADGSANSFNPISGLPPGSLLGLKMSRRGVIVGQSAVTGDLFLWAQGSVQNLNGLSSPTAVNDARYVLGFSSSPTGSQAALRTPDGDIVPLLPEVASVIPANATSVSLQPVDMNEDCQIALTLSYAVPTGTGTTRRFVTTGIRLDLDQCTARSLTVNSTGDGSATDPAEDGCDTGSTVGGSPECTLRAAIEAANANGGGEITFDIDGGGTPTIQLGSALPAVTQSTVIDATSQPGGRVAVSGPNTVTALTLSGGTSVVKGLVVQGVDRAIAATGGTGHRIEGNRVGTNADGTAAVGTPVNVGVRIGAPDVVVADNHLVARVGGGSIVAGSGATFRDNLVGVDASGSTKLGETQGGVILFGPDGTATGNVIVASSAGVLTSGPGADGASIVDNTIGLNAAGTAPLAMDGYGIRVDATPRVTVTGNRVGDAGNAAISVTGTDQLTELPDGDLSPNPSSDADEGGTVTGGDVEIRGNVVGLSSGGSDSVPGTAPIGIEAFGDASDVRVVDNTVAGQTEAGIDIFGGSGHRIEGNRLGWNATLSARVPQDTGVRLQKVTDTVVGGSTAAGPNDIGSAEFGVDLGDGADGVRLLGNRIRGARRGVYVGSGATATRIADNTISGGALGIYNEGEATVVEENRIGTDDAGTTVVGNTAGGIQASGGDVAVTRNTIAGSGAVGVQIDTGAVATLRGNRIFQNGQLAVDGAGALAAPRLAAAVRTAEAPDARTVLVVDQLPRSASGRIEIFASDSCDVDEARYALDVERTKDADSERQVIVILGNATRRHFTALFTDAEGKSSKLSKCIDADAAVDGDGDGAADQIEGILDLDGDPAAALLVTDREQLLLVGSIGLPDPADPTGPPLAVAGTLRNVAAVDDPAPGGRPANIELPYGVVRFEVDVPNPGDRTAIAFLAIDEAARPAGSYWKYGPQTFGGPSSWYDFAPDTVSGTGWFASGFLGVPWQGGVVGGILLKDGARGDADLSPNGRIVDPGGLAIDSSGPPPTTSTTTSTTSTSTSTTTVPPTTSTTTSTTSTSTTTSTTTVPPTTTTTVPPTSTSTSTTTTSTSTTVPATTTTVDPKVTTTTVPPATTTTAKPSTSTTTDPKPTTTTVKPSTTTTTVPPAAPSVRLTASASRLRPRKAVRLTARTADVGARSITVIRNDRTGKVRRVCVGDGDCAVSVRNGAGTRTYRATAYQLSLRGLRTVARSEAVTVRWSR